MSQGKRDAQSLEDLETSETKKLKRSDISQELPQFNNDDKDGEDQLMSTLDTEEDSVSDPKSGGPATAAIPTTEEAETRKSKVKATKGADIHFKENPYTFISPEDPIIQNCVLVYFSISAGVLMSHTVQLEASFET